MNTRTRARELVLKCLYAFESLGGDERDVFEKTCGKSGQDATVFEFAWDIYRTVLKRLKKIDSQIREHSENWDLDRLAIVDKNILRIAVCELFYFPSIPAKVSINEAIELAKKYSTLDSAGFVNGILDSIFKRNIDVLREGTIINNN
jgi:transcription antitermination factor NusB